MTNKPTRGRPKGSTSFTRVRLLDLTNYLGKEAPVVVSKKWLEQIGFEVEEKTIEVLTPVSDEPKIQFNVTH
jgi:hypothetical protein